MRQHVGSTIARWANSVPDVLAVVDPEVAFVPRSIRALWEPDTVHLTPGGSHALGEQLAEQVLLFIQDPDFFAEEVAKCGE